MSTNTGQEPTTPTTPEPDTGSAAADAGSSGTTPAASSGGSRPPAPWERDGEAFDAERAWTLIQNLRAEVADAKKHATPTPPLPAAPDAELSAHVASLSHQLARERVARRHELPDDLVDLLGDGDETALAERAAALIAWRDRTTPEPEPAPRRPTAKPRGGADPTKTPTETDPAKLAAAVAARAPHL